ncbi:MAG: hypothetical protein V8R01_07265 [Bacilli bacterium]
MTSIEALNKMADDTPDSKNTNPGDTLYFSSCCTAGKSLKKLKIIILLLVIVLKS